MSEAGEPDGLPGFFLRPGVPAARRPVLCRSIMRLKDRVAIITGAGSGLGRAGALAFAREGARVVVSDLDPTRGAETVEMLHAEGLDGRFVRADVSQGADA